MLSLEFRQLIARFCHSDWFVASSQFSKSLSTAVRSDVYGNCLNIINNGSTWSVMFLSTSGLFPALRKILLVGNNPVVLKYSTGHAGPLFITLPSFNDCRDTS